MTDLQPFSAEQQAYLQGLALGADVAPAVRRLPVLTGSRGAGADRVGEETMPALGPEAILLEAQDRVLADGRTLSTEEQAKRGKNPLGMWDEIRANAAAGAFPEGTDTFLYKALGLFHVAPAQDAFMCRLRVPGGVLNSHQFRGVADLADAYGGGYADVTTRANLQIREIAHHHADQVLTGLTDLGIIIRGSGGDNVRNITANPTCGIDPQELIDPLPLARQLHHDILRHRELYGLPRKFNIAFDGGGRVASLENTNDVGFTAVQVDSTETTENVRPGVHFRMALGGITGHGDFALDSGVLLEPEQCLPVAKAVLRTFIEQGDRTNRRTARLKYLIDRWGMERFLEEVDLRLRKPMPRFPLERCRPRREVDRHGHVGVHPQKQAGLHYVGIVLPVGRLTVRQMRGLADLANRRGGGVLRLTVWQNLLISDVLEKDVEAAVQEIEDLGLTTSATSFRAGLVACTGSTGCKYAAADTKRHAMVLAEYLEHRVPLDQPINIHLTGCHHSCAQHCIGDIGLLATQVEWGDDLVEGYHLVVGGAHGSDRTLGRQILDGVPFDELPPLIERLIFAYLEDRRTPNESFDRFARRHTEEELRRRCARQIAAA